MSGSARSQVQALLVAAGLCAAPALVAPSGAFAQEEGGQDDSASDPSGGTWGDESAGAGGGDDDEGDRAEDSDPWRSSNGPSD